MRGDDRDALLTADNLHGLTDVFSKLNLLKTEKNQVVLRTDSGPLAEVLRRIEERSSYGDAATGKYLEQELAKEPFGSSYPDRGLLPGPYDLGASKCASDHCPASIQANGS